MGSCGSLEIHGNVLADLIMHGGSEPQAGRWRRGQPMTQRRRRRASARVGFCMITPMSTVNHSRGLYIGSTPNPVRRLRQHNGLAKGGAARTKRDSLRPWEMGCIVTGFPSQVAALKFEWAWQHPHVTQHIPPESRLTFATQKKRSGQPKNPRHTVKSLLSNLHLLLSVPSFSRWPLDVRFFAQDLHKEWDRLSKIAPDQLRDSFPIIADYPPNQPLTLPKVASTEDDQRKRDEGIEHGIHALNIDYEKHKQHVIKGRDITIFEREGSCAVCHTDLEHEGGIYTICPNPTCAAVTHITCLSKHFLVGDEESMIPIRGTCPSCRTEQTWVDVVKELTLRMRGQKEVEKLLKKKRGSKAATNILQGSLETSDLDEDTDSSLQMSDESDGDSPLASQPEKSRLDTGDEWHEIPDSEDSDDDHSTDHKISKTTVAMSNHATSALPTVIEDSDWDDIDRLD
ncbi:hypothetical protein B7463_g5607, partial [Scytalidium lignicola]